MGAQQMLRNLVVNDLITIGGGERSTVADGVLCFYLSLRETALKANIS